MQKQFDEFDYIVIGAGSAGCTLAARLSEDPDTHVLLLEAGPWDRHPYIQIPLGIGKLLERRLFDWGLRSEPEPGLDGRSIGAECGKVIGGSSSINVMGYTRGDASDYDRWARNGATGWSHADVLPYFRRSESWEDGSSDLRGGGGPVGVQRARTRDPLARAWVDAAAASGIRENVDPATGDTEGFGTMQFTIRNGRRASAANAYLKPALARNNLRVAVNALANRIVLTGTRATGVEYSQHGVLKTASARREVLLSSGAFNSPQILMLSGIGPGDHLRALGIPVLADLPVGDNLQDHMAVVNMYSRTAPGEFHRAMRLDHIAASMLRAQFLRSGFATQVPSGVVGFVRTDPELPSPDVEFMFLFSPPGAGPWFPGWRKPYADAFGIRPTLLHPHSRGKVRLRSQDPRAPVHIHFNALTAPEDIVALRRAFRLGREIARQAPLDPFRGAELAPGLDIVSDSGIDAYIRSTAITAHHPCGTCALGTGNNAVLDPELRVRGIEGLRVVDASAMPDLVSAHVNACVLMMAEKAADLIREKAR